MRFPSLAKLLEPPLWPRLTTVFVGVGVFCRLAQYLSNRSLWHDEVSIALNLVGLDFLALLGPLERDQAAPPLWSMLQRATVLALGESEYSLRLWPAVAGIAALLVFPVLARKLVTPRAVPAAVLLFAVSDRLITHTAEVKPYSSDVLIAILLLILAHGSPPTGSPLRGLARATALAIPAIWFSFPAVFVYGAASMTAVRRLVVGRPHVPGSPAAAGGRAWAAYAALNVLAATSFVALMAFSSSGQSTPYLREYWREGFPLAQPLWRFPVWLIEVHYELWNYAYDPMGWLMIVLCVFGVKEFWGRGRRTDLALLLLPLALTFGAACLERYPYLGNRFLLFAMPSLLLIGAEGLLALMRRLPPAPAYGLAALLFVPGLAVAGYHLIWPRSRHELRPILAGVQERLQPGDRLLVGAYDSFDYYWDRLIPGGSRSPRAVPPKRMPGDVRTIATPRPHQVVYAVFSPHGLQAEIEGLAEASRLWIIYTAHGRVQPQVDALIDGVRGRAREVETLKAVGARAHLFVVRKGPDRP